MSRVIDMKCEVVMSELVVETDPLEKSNFQWTEEEIEKLMEALKLIKERSEHSNAEGW